MLTLTGIHYCGSGSGIPCLFYPWIRDGKKSDPGLTSRIRKTAGISINLVKDVTTIVVDTGTLATDQSCVDLNEF
jgi:hypothetical protein